MGTGKLLGKPNKLWAVTCDGLANRPGEVGILLAASCYSNRDKLRQLCREPVLAPRLNFTMRICLLLRATQLVRTEVICTFSGQTSRHTKRQQFLQRPICLYKKTLSFKWYNFQPGLHYDIILSTSINISIMNVHICCILIYQKQKHKLQNVFAILLKSED